ncbi:MAG: hypothetical protein IJG42_04755, partial [Muribaculaceae bacterium]|nr:hypothetical protein [Muribaculaceae bacterium]
GGGGGGGGAPGPGGMTGTTDIGADRTVVDVMYVNPLGMKSDRPFDGVNIIVTRYSDGTVTTTKVLK